MIQRIQTLFLLAAAAAVLLMFGFALVEYRSGETGFTLGLVGLSFADGGRAEDVSLQMPLAALAVALAAMWVLLIFLFRNRQRQVRLIRYTYLVGAALVVAEWITHRSVVAYLKQGGAVDAMLQPAFFLPLAGLVLAYLAERAIKKDDDLVRSADRLR